MESFNLYCRGSIIVSLFPCLLFFQDDYLSSPFQVKVENQESALAGLLLTDLEGSAPIPLMLDENGYICRKTDSGVEFAYLRVPTGYTLELVAVDEEAHILYSYTPAFTPPTDGETVIVTKD